MATLEILDYRTKVALEELPAHLQRSILNEVPETNQKILFDFLYDLINRENVTPSTKMMYVKNLLYLMRAVNHKPIAHITRDDILLYLHSLRKPLHIDPRQRWISTHNNRAVMYQKFVNLLL
jgi:hypothetical protein